MVAARQEIRSVTNTIKQQWSEGAVGYVPEVKDDRTCRFVFENYNSLSFWNSQHKIHHLNKLLRQFDADCALGAELQVQWDMADTNLRLEKLLMPGQQKRVAVGYNKHEAFNRSQHGGVSLATFDRLSQFVLESGSDPHGLGRWVWMKVSSGSLITIIVHTYPANRRPQRRHPTNAERLCIISKEDTSEESATSDVQEQYLWIILANSWNCGSNKAIRCCFSPTPTVMFMTVYLPKNYSGTRSGWQMCVKLY